jgi:RNA polymerase-binding transcription factor DksA
MRNDIDFAYFKERLLAERASLLEELGKIAQKSSTESDGWEAKPGEMDEATRADSIDRADRLEEFEERRSTENELAKQLTQVERALAKIEEGTYGICDVSSEPIEVERLEANPAATTKAKYAS